MIRLATALALVVALSGACGDGDKEPETAPGPSTSSPDSTSVSASASETQSLAPLMTLREVCPEVEAALPGGMIPKRGPMNTFVGQLNHLQSTGDVEAQNALELLLPASSELQQVIALSGTGSLLTDTLSAWIDAISAFAKRCKAAGSSALQ